MPTVLILLLSLFASQAFQPVTRSITVGTQRIVLAAPKSFVEVSDLFPDGFQLRQEMIPKTNRLLAWLMSPDDIRDRLNGVLSEKGPILQVQVLVTLIDGQYDATVIGPIAREIKEGVRLQQQVTDEMAKNPKLAEVGLKLGIRQIGLLDQGADFVTMGSVTTIEADGAASSRLSVTSIFLLRTKLLYLIVNGAEDSPNERKTLLGILEEWRAAMRAANR